MHNPLGYALMVNFMDYKEYAQIYKKINFYDQIKNNKIKTAILIFVISLIIVALMYIVAQMYNPAFTFLFLIIGIIISLTYSLISYFYSDKLALASVKAYEAKEKKYDQLNNLIEGLALATGMPKPKVYIMPSKEINAFASGRNPQNAVICVTEGALELLNKRELEGVLAHELGHIQNYDILYVTIVVIMVGLISIISELFLRSLWISNNNDNKNIVFVIIGVVLAILAPFVATLVQLSISRKREYIADATAVKTTKDNSGLINALKKINEYYSKNGQKTKANQMVSQLFITGPKLSNLLSTHPKIEERIKVLEQM